MAGKKQKLLQKADGFARDKKLKKAIGLYQQVIEEDAGDIRTRLRLSELLYQVGRLAEALEILQFVGDYYKEHGFLLKSVAVYKKMLEVDPSRTDLHGILAQLYFQLGMAPDAIRQFKAQNRALIKQGKVVDSLYVVRSMLELDPANVTDRLRLAESFSKHELIDEAADEYRRVLSVIDRNGNVAGWGQVAMRYLHHNPRDFEVRKRVIEQMLEAGDYHKCLQHLHVCMENDPHDTELLDMAADCFDMLGQPEKSIVALKSMVSVYRQKGLGDEVQEVHARVLQLDPKDEQSLNALGIMGGEEEDPEELELQWDMPAGHHDLPPPTPTEFGETVHEVAPSFVEEEWAEPTIIEPISEDLLEELDLLGEDGSGVLSVAVDVIRLKRAIDAGAPLSPAELEDCGVQMSPDDKEELEFFISSGLTEEAMSILQEIHSRLESGA